MVNPDCDGGHKNRDLLSPLRRNHDIEPMNATFLVNRRPPDTIRAPQPNRRVFQYRKLQPGNLDGAAASLPRSSCHVV
jgi:hypothetical protein